MKLQFCWIGLTATREPETLKRLHQRLSAQLTTEQFVLAAQAVFDTSRFFPTVEEFISAVKGNAETNALHEWNLSGAEN